MKLVLGAVGMLLLAGCGGGDDQADPSSFEAMPWVLSAGVDVDGWEIVAPSLRFEEGRIGGSTGCNRYGASYTVDDDTLEIGEIASTLIACQPPADAVERAFVGVLPRAARWRIEGDELVLLDVEDVELLRFVAATPAGSWQATGFLQGDAVTSPIAGTEVTASFATDGTLAGSAGCNTYTAQYTLDRDTISIDPPATTRKSCAEPAGVMEQEAAYLAALVQAERFSVGGGSLELLRSDGTNVAAFSRSN